MGIRFLCQFCQKRIHVKAYLAGKKAECPHCKGKIRIPDPASEGQETQIGQVDADSRDTNRSQSTSSSSLATSPNSPGFTAQDPNSFTLDRPEEIEQRDGQLDCTDWIADAPNASWYLRLPSGKQYGPAPGHQMRSWVEEGRVHEGCFVWREGWANWRRSTDVFPKYFKAQADKELPIFSENPDEEESAPGSGSSPAGPNNPSDLKHPNKRSSNSFWLLAGLVLLTVTVAVIGVLGISQLFPAKQNSKKPSQESAEQENEKVVDPFAKEEQDS